MFDGHILHCVTQMWPIVTDVSSGMVCVLGWWLYCAKMAEPQVCWFVGQTHVSSRTHLFDRGLNPLGLGGGTLEPGQCDFLPIYFT